jgi:4-hydroxythreonine-4-phosphate dehydrogenase
MRSASRPSPTLVFTQGDPAGIGPELLLRLLAEQASGRLREGGGYAAPAFRSIVVAERAALEAYAASAPGLDLAALGDGVAAVAASPSGDRSAGVSAGDAEETVTLIDPVGRPRRVVPGRPSPADATGAMAALECAVELMEAGAGDALVTLPVNKAEIARHVDPTFRGHTDWLAAACGAERYGRDYLMTFLAADLQVALLSMHVPLRQAIASLETDGIVDALRCLDGQVARHPLPRRAAGEGRAKRQSLHPRIAVAGLNPHAGEQGLLGGEDDAIVRPAVERARAEGIDASGPWSPDSLFVRARRGEFDWVLALYHDQGLIAVKTVSFGAAANWTLGLPWIRTSVDHGTAYDLAGSGRAELEPLRHVVAATLALLAGDLPRGLE